MKRTTLALAVACAAFAVNAQEPASTGDAREQDPWAPATFADFRLRAIGPALMSGRISHIAIHPESKQTWYIGVASGGVWKTTNAGITFTPVFQNEGSYSIGTVVVGSEAPGHDLGWHRRGQQSAERRLRRRHLSKRRCWSDVAESGTQNVRAPRTHRHRST